MEYIVSYRIVSREKPSYRIDIVSNRKKAYRYWLVTVAVNNILKDLDGVAGVHIAQENLPMLEEEEEEELEVTEIEMVVME